MPVKSSPKPPRPGASNIDARPRTPTDSTPPAPQTTRFTPDPVTQRIPGETPESAGSTADSSPAPTTSRVQVHASTSASAEGASADVPALQQYLIPASITLPGADADGLRTFKGRQYADVRGGGTVLLAVDAQTGLHRARLSSELQPSGPVLAHDPASNHWYPLQDFAVSAPQAVMPRKSRRSPRRSDDEFEMALEELPRNDDGASEQFYLASESMPIKPYTAAELRAMRSETRYSFLGNQLGTYNRANNGKYPLRDIAGRPIRIRKLETKVRLAEGELYTSEQIKPYIKFEGHEDVAMLYEQKLQWRVFTETDVKVPGEKALIGQSMVVANRRIAKGEAIGVYGGVIMPARFVRPYEQTFSMLAGVRLQYGPGQMLPDPLAILGDNIISRINSNFEYNEAGRPIRQAPGGYNVETVPFDIEAQQWVGDKQVSRDFILNAVFASQDIPAGTELRLDYNYSEQQMSWAFPD
ncbi:SET domain-containing protein [Pseudomonas retamae]|uniref:SET domain-containing protein n=1 Tax=Pseudomonas retamae TaxID=702110 RepID=A0ABW7D981_9PSED